MNFLKNVFGRIWALWGLSTFFATMMVAILFYLPCFLMREPYAARWHRSVSRVWMSIFLTLVVCPLRTKGRENYIKGRNYVVVCNHRSLMDVPVTTPFMPNANKTIAKKSFALVPIFGWIYSLGSVLLDRKSAVSRRKSFEQMRKVLAIGLDMVIYPEGTRNRTSAPLKNFYDGAFRLAVVAEKPIIPVLIFNTDKVLPTNKFFYMMPHKLEMHFLPPVQVNAGDNVNELKTRLFNEMSAYYAAHKKG
ncbi:1-acyl-sn-glycerol-3-phosphate acyltransferase [Filimonas lacunae]|uniref:1-acyl-sn-glycerol-3-phosphate acyltransferase n=1 Tax=Filimonas lacunae TaxID=477680 RepID=A0A173MEK1_9BACT|nr:lysophospholipid acyltransferase family protein [Filimonas lacunae]BAV05909.1 1-acyl-sn-glycerol-3-phosphate acyltransferase [Filimonas lacunae]SIT34530.1 1-acyl-sn-glycerol-3-phosphate acyltransferase [Filimonas lacunae]